MKAPSTGATQPNTPWSERWTNLLEAFGYDLRRGRSYSRRGHVQWVEVQVGRIIAQVKDRDQGQCDVEILINRLNDEEWSQVLDALSSQALFAAQLLAGDMPTSIEEGFEQTGVHLLPGGAYELESQCSCCADWEQPCKHAAATYYTLGQMLDDDPWLLFRLRGRERQQVLQALRRRRSEPNQSYAGATPLDERAAGALPGQISSLTKTDEAVPPLSAQIDDYWGESKRLDDLHHYIGAPPIKLALLRRLGPPPFPSQSLETYDRLQEIYRNVTEQALALAFAPEPEEANAAGIPPGEHHGEDDEAFAH